MPRVLCACGLQMLPSELFQAHTAVEYVLPQPVLAPPAFLFVVDLALADAAELEARPWRCPASALPSARFHPSFDRLPD